MDTKKFITGTLTGGIVYFFLGFVVYALLLEDFYVAHAGSATGVIKTEMEFWPLLLGNFAQAALLTYVFLKWANIKSFSDGVTGGSIIGFLMTLGHNMISYDTTNISDFSGSITDVFVYTAITGITGGVIGAVLGMGKN